MKRFLASVITAAAMATLVQAQDHPYPIGTVVAPDGNNMPTREQQKFTYEWLSRAGLNTIEHELMPVAGGYLDWAMINPKKGTYDWKPYDITVEDSEASNLDVFLEVFTIRGGMPDWIFEKHPDAYMQTPLGGGDALTTVKRDNKLDINSFPSVTHPVYIAAVEDYARAIAKRYKDRKRVRGYIIAEEFGLPGVWPAMNFYGIDFSPSMRDLLHTRLQEKYGTVDAMNKAWGQPGKYKDFKDVVWKRGWVHDAKNFRGEWMEYYQTLQFAFAEHHNRIARAIKQEDPDAIVMVSDYQPMVNRVGHGSHAALLKDVDAFGFKSYWNDVRMQMDFCSGITGGKQIWCTNFSEDDTTRGGIQQRYMNAEYVRRQFWPAYARGMAGLFLFIWSPQQAEKMSLLEPSENGSLDTISSITTVTQLREFMDTYQPELAKFKPERAHVVVHDPNLTYIGQHWDFAPKDKEREKWFSETPAIASFQTVIDDLAAHNRRFTVSTESTLASKLGDPATRVLALTGSELLDAPSLAAVQKWIESGKPTILDDRSGKYDEFSRVKDALQKYRGRANVLTLSGERWDRDKEQRPRLGAFFEKNLPLRYAGSKNEGTDIFTVDYLTADDGAEMAIITRRGPQGRLQDQIDVQLKWQKPHAKLQVLDPFATRSMQSTAMEPKDASAPGVTLKGFQDVLLVIGR